MIKFIQRIQSTGYTLPTLLTGYLWLKGRHPELPGFACPFFATTGIPCPGCFLTRATAAALNGDLSQAAELHLFGPPAALALIAWSALALRRRKIAIQSINIKHISLSAALLVAYWFFRIVAYYYLGIRGFPAFIMQTSWPYQYT